MIELEKLKGMNDEERAKLKKVGIESSEQLKARLSDADALSTASGVAKERLLEWKKELDTVGYTAKRKPELTPDIRRALKRRRELDARRPDFYRSEYYKALRMGLKWRKPRGKQSKMRLCAYYRPRIVSIGYGTPSAARHLHPSGFRERLVRNVTDVKDVDPKTTAIRVHHAVGTRKRAAIIEEADKLEIRVLNR